MSASFCFSLTPFPVCNPLLVVLLVFGGSFLLLLVVGRLLRFAVKCHFSPFGAFPSDVSLRLPPALFSASASSCGSSSIFFLLLGGHFLLPWLSWRSLYRGFSLPLALVCFVLALALFVASSSPVGFPCSVLLGLRFLASFDSVLALFLFASFMTRSNLGSFATGSSLQAECSLSVVASVCLVVWVLCPLVFGPIPLLVILLSFLLLFVEGVPIFCVVSFLGFPYISPLWRFAFAHLRFFFFSYSLLLLCPLTGFSLLPPSAVAVFSCYIHVQLQLCSPFHYFVVLSFLTVGGRALVSSLTSSLSSSASILPCLLGRCAWHRHLSPLVCCVHGDSTASSQP